MASPGFGFSVGDVLAGLHVVRKLIRALNDTAGSRAAYQKLISELLNLENALTGVHSLQVDLTQAAQKIALEQVAQQCQRSIEKFLTKNAKFQSSLGIQPSSSAWRSNLHKFQWALCKDNEIEGLRAEIAAHSTTLTLILSTIQLSATKLHSESIDERAQLAQATWNDGDETKALANKNNQLLTTQADLIAMLSSTIANLSPRTQTRELQSLMQKILESNTRIFTAVLEMQRLQANLPPQIERQQPILFEDAHERLTPFATEFINSFAAFQAVLEVRFKHVPGLNKVRGLEYVVQDTASKKVLDLSRPWESIFRPGRRVVMSMLFQQVESTVTSCPGCLKNGEDVHNENTAEDTHTQCLNPACGIWYRRVTEINKRPRVERQDQRSAKRQRVSGGEEGAENEISDFRRVQIVQEKHYSNHNADGDSPVPIRKKPRRAAAPTWPTEDAQSEVASRLDGRSEPLESNFASPVNIDDREPSNIFNFGDKRSSPSLWVIPEAPFGAAPPPPLPPPRFIPVEGPLPDHNDFYDRQRRELHAESPSVFDGRLESNERSFNLRSWDSRAAHNEEPEHARPNSGAITTARDEDWVSLSSYSSSE